MVGVTWPYRVGIQSRRVLSRRLQNLTVFWLGIYWTGRARTCWIVPRWFDLDCIHKLKPASMSGPQVDCGNCPRASECICQARTWLESILSVFISILVHSSHSLESRKFPFSLLYFCIDLLYVLSALSSVYIAIINSTNSPIQFHREIGFPRKLKWWTRILEGFIMQ